MDGAYARRAEQAQAGQESELDRLLADASVEGRARREAGSEPLDLLMSKLPPNLMTASVSELRQHLADRRSRAAGLSFKDEKAYNWHLMIARIERFLAIREAEEREQPSVQEQSSAWLSNSLQQTNAQPAQQPAAGPARQVRPALLGAPGRTRDFGGLDYEHDGQPGTRQPLASRGAPPKKTKQSLLQPTRGGVLGKWPQAGPGQQKQQQQEHRLRDVDSLCKICTQPPAPGSALRLVNVNQGGFTIAVLACSRCFAERNLQPVVARAAQVGTHGATGETAAHPAASPHAREATAKKKHLDRLPGLRPQLSLKPTAPFYSGTPSAPGAPGALLDVGGNVGRPAAGSRPARQPTRGKGKQQPRGDDDGDWYPDERAVRQQQQADADDDSDFDWQQAPRRRPRQRQRTQAANEEPVTMTIDLLSDDDPEHHQQQQQQQQQQQPGGCDGPAQPALPAPADGEGAGGRTRPPRAARAAQYVPVSERFKGLRCLYPREGGPGSVEVTALDLSRLDDGEFLNDSVIDFYIRWLQDQLPPEVLERCYFFNTFFFKKLVEDRGGSLTPELREWAEQEKIVKHKLQALHNHQKVKKWTKDVDLFAKDFIFVPVHEALHWSLMVVCHPGVVMPKDGEVQSPGAPTPCILHLDSLSGNHRMGKLANSLRLYLSFEWHIKSLPDAPDGVPKRWAQAHPGEKRSWLPPNFPNKSVKVPGQENHCDCGLFMCSYIEYFVHRLPRAINVKDVEALQKDYAKTNRDLFEGTDDCVPGLLTDKWFPKDNPSHLRWRLRHNLLRLMAEQCGLVDPDTQQCRKGDPMAEEVQRELLQLEQRSLEYLSPAEWQSRALANKQQRAAALRRREAELEERKAARQQRQAAAAKSPGSTRSGSVDREKLAAAAEARLSQEQPYALFDGLRDVATQGEDDGSDLSFELQARQPARRGAGEVQPQQQQQAPRLSSRLQRQARQPSPEEARLREELEDREACKQLAGSDPDGGGFEIVLNGSDGEDDGVGKAQEGVARDVVAGASLRPEPAVLEDLCPVPGSPPMAADGGTPPAEHALEPSSAGWLRGGAQPGAALGPAAQLQQEAPAGDKIQVFSRKKQKQKQQHERQRQGLSGPAGSPGPCPMQQLEEQSHGWALGQEGPPPQEVLARDGSAAALDWARVVHVAGVFSNGSGQETRRPDDRCTAELRFFYLDARDYAARLPFPADRTAASLESLYSWVHAHSHHLGRQHQASLDLQHLKAWGSSEQAGQQPPRELRVSSKQGNGEATARTRRGASAPLEGRAAAAAAVAAAPLQQQQQYERQEGEIGAGITGSERLGADGGLPSMPDTQPADVPPSGSQDLWAAGLAASPPVEERAPWGLPAEQFIPLGGPAGADLEQSGSGRMQEELQGLHLEQPRPAAPAVAAAAALQRRHDSLRQGSLSAAAACPLPDQRQQASLPALAAGEADAVADPQQGVHRAVAAAQEQACRGSDAPVHGGSSKRLHAAAPGGHEAELAGKRRRRAGEPRRLERSGGGQDEAAMQEQQQQEPRQHEWNRHLLAEGARSGVPPSSMRPGSAALRTVHNVDKPTAAAPPPRLGNGHGLLGGASGRDPGGAGQQAGQAALPPQGDDFGQPSAYDRRYAVQAAALVDDAVADAARQMQHAGHDQPAQQAHAAQPAAAAGGFGSGSRVQPAQGQQQGAQLAEPQAPGHRLTPHEVETMMPPADPSGLGDKVKQRAKTSGFGALVRKLGSHMKAATVHVGARQQREQQENLKRLRGGSKQAGAAGFLRPADAVDLVSDDE